MATVESIIKDVYGRATDAADKLGVKPSAVSNWKAAGCFPPRLVLPIWRDAKARGVALEPDEIPVADTVQ